MKPLKSLCPLSFALLLTANLVFAQFGGQRLPTTPPTFPQQKSSDRPELIDINSASKEQLLTLPGIDESRAERIIETRPYKNKKELKKKKIVPEEVYKRTSAQQVSSAHEPMGSVAIRGWELRRGRQRPSPTPIIEAKQHLKLIATSKSL